MYFLFVPFLNLTGDIKAEKFDNQKFDDVDTSMAKNSCRFIYFLRFYLRTTTFIQVENFFRM